MIEQARVCEYVLFGYKYRFTETLIGHSSGSADWP